MGDISLSTDIFRCHYVENHVGIGKEKATQVCGISYSFGLFAASHFFYDKKNMPDTMDTSCTIRPSDRSREAIHRHRMGPGGGNGSGRWGA